MSNSGIKSVTFSKWAAVFALQGALSVAAGAFGAHALTEILDPKSLGWWHTASQYTYSISCRKYIIRRQFIYDGVNGLYLFRCNYACGRIMLFTRLVLSRVSFMAI